MECGTGVQQVIARIQSGQIVDYRDAKYSNVKFLSEERASRLIPRHNGWAYELINEATPVRGSGSRLACEPS